MEKEERDGYPAIDPAVNNITRTIIGCAYTISNSLGSGFLEKVYENVLVCELVKQGLKVKQQQLVKIWCNGTVEIKRLVL